MLVPVYRRLVCDSLTPVSAFHKIDSGRCACLFESVVGGEKVGRYSFLAADPFFEIEAYGRRVTTTSYTGVSASGAPLPSTRSYEAANPMDELRRHVEALRAVHLPELPPFCGGAVGYAGYDTVRYFERLPNAAARRPAGARPVLRLLRPHGHLRPRQQDDRRRGDGPARSSPARPCESAYDDACRRVDAPGRATGRAIERLATWSIFGPAARSNLEYRSNFTPAAVRGGGREVRGVHPRRRHLSGRAQPAAGGAAHGASVRHLPHAARGQPQPVHVLSPHAQRDAGRQLAGDHGPRRGRAR